MKKNDILFSKNVKQQGKEMFLKSLVRGEPSVKLALVLISCAGVPGKWAIYSTYTDIGDYEFFVKLAII